MTPYRDLMQPLSPGVIYQAHIFNLDLYGNRSRPSDVVLFQHDSTALDAQRQRMTGFFDDFNQPMGTFDEKWNLAHSGCVEAGFGILICILREMSMPLSASKILVGMLP